MEYCKPSVYRIAETALNEVQFNLFLEHVGAPGWTTNAATDSELLIEAAGKLCYKSFSADLNPNLTIVRQGHNHNFIGNLMRQHHGSVFEHAHVTFAMMDLSRIATHELVRHRLANYSQESLRFVRPTSLRMYYPEAFDQLTTDPVSDDQMIKLIDIHSRSPDAGRLRLEHADSVRDCVLAIFEQHITDVERVHHMLVVLTGLDDATRPFKEKKRLTSALRRLLPDGMATGIIMTANHRVWRDVIERRTSVAAEEEIRYIFNAIADSLAGQFPAIYQDMQEGEVEDGIPERLFINSRI
jgi:thymidylate synthase (FAD)